MTFLMPCQPLPPGQLAMVFSILILHSNPGDFLFLDKFTSTGFINKIYNMEASIFFQNPNNKWAIISLVMDTSATLFVLCC